MDKEKLIEYIVRNITSNGITINILENLIDYANEYHGHSKHSPLYLVYDVLKDFMSYEELEQFEDLSGFSM